MLMIGGVEWSTSNNVSPEIVSFIKEYPEYLSSDTIVSMRLNLRPSPRSWYKLANVLSLMSEEDIKTTVMLYPQQ